MKAYKNKKIRELKDVTAIYVSLVKRAANQKKFFLIKEKDLENKENIGKEVKIIAKNYEKQLIVGIVYEPMVVDSQGDFMVTEEIEKTCNEFNVHFRAIDKDHNCIPGAGQVVQSYTAPTDMEIEGNIVKAGSWVIVTKADDETWEEVKKSNYQGYSMWGLARDVVEHNYEDVFKADNDEKNKINKDFDKELNNFQQNDAIFLYLGMLEKSIWESYSLYMYGNEYDTLNLKEEILKSIKQFKSKIEKMSFEIQKSNDGKNQNRIITKISKEEHDMDEKEIKSLIENTVSEKIESFSKELSEKVGKIEESIETLKVEKSNSEEENEEVDGKGEIYDKLEELSKDINQMKEDSKKINDFNEKISKSINDLKNYSLESGASGNSSDASNSEKKIKSESYLGGGK